jgi:hypothetical protein
MHARHRLQVFASRRDPDRAWLLHALERPRRPRDSFPLVRGVPSPNGSERAGGGCDRQPDDGGARRQPAEVGLPALSEHALRKARRGAGCFGGEREHRCVRDEHPGCRPAARCRLPVALVRPAKKRLVLATVDFAQVLGLLLGPPRAYGTRGALARRKASQPGPQCVTAGARRR